LISLGLSRAYVVRWVFLRVLALAWAAAFVSLGVQVDGLAGPNGILPAGEWLDAVRGAVGGDAVGRVPTVCWWLGTGTGALEGLCAAGAVLAGLLALGVFPGLVSSLLWVLYLSVASVCGVFLSFQWDALLLETGMLAAFLAPWKPWAPGLAGDRPPARTAVLLLRLLLFKLMFLSGVVKLTSGDPTWRDLSALEYHYWTTCLPSWTGWHAHHLPVWFHRASVAGMLAVEIVVPFLVFAPVRWLRTAAAAVLLALQLGIAATGNYGFFNLLTAALCVTALDDNALLAAAPRRLRARIRPPESHAWVPPWRQAPALILAAAYVPLSLAVIAGRTAGYDALPRPAIAALSAVQPYRSLNGYGLFANMTTRRMEIEVQGSADGREWKTYEFRWKPGDPARRPAFQQPHMPRLDWQMWFAALADWRSQEWFFAFLERLLQGSPPVLELLEGNPFPDRPPRYVRARTWDYRFTTPAERRETGDWWRREPQGPYGPVVELGEDGRIRPVPDR
jgi:hypothetical protein